MEAAIAIGKTAAGSREESSMHDYSTKKRRIDSSVDNSNFVCEKENDNTMKNASSTGNIIYNITFGEKR